MNKPMKLPGVHSLRAILLDLADSLSTDEAGLFYSTRNEDCGLIESANEILQNANSVELNCRILLLREVIYNRLCLAPGDIAHKTSSEIMYHNSVSGGVKSHFFQRLHCSNQGAGYADPDWQIIAFETDGSIQVRKADLTLWVQPNPHLITPLISEGIGDVLSIRLPKNILDPGVYIAVGNAGRVSPTSNDDTLIGQLHFNFEAIHAPDILTYWTSALNQLAVPFCFAVGHESCAYDRPDPGILIFNLNDTQIILKTLDSFLVQSYRLLRNDTAIFTKPIAPGIGYAEHPLGTTLSFHLHRCHLVAQGLFMAWKNGFKSGVIQPNLNGANQITSPALAAIEHCFEQHGLNLDAPYHNPGSDNTHLTINA